MPGEKERFVEAMDKKSYIQPELTKLDLRAHDPELQIAVQGKRNFFVERMLAVQRERSTDVGGHTYMDAVQYWGPALMYAEIASIDTRLKSIFWDGGPDDPRKLDVDRAQDLLVDLANYAQFLYEFLETERD